MSLLAEMNVFYTEHRRRGELDRGGDGRVVWIRRTISASPKRELVT